MIEVVTGPFSRFSPEHRAAVEDLTTKRYSEDLLDHDHYITHVSGIAPSSEGYHAARAAMIEAFRADYRTTETSSHVGATFTRGANGRPIALGAMRYTRGARADLSVTASIGRADSSLQTHALLRDFRYPRLPGFDPDRDPETRLVELGRWVAVDPNGLRDMVAADTLTSTEADYALWFGTAEISLQLHRMTSRYRVRRNGQPLAGYLWTCAPRSAVLLHRRMGLRLIPLFADGCQPTDLALSQGCFAAPLFARYQAELEAVAERIRPAGACVQADADPASVALRHLATATKPQAAAGTLSLPYLLPYDDDTFARFDDIEDALAAAETTFGVRVAHVHLETGAPL
ncbi:hypothetical protein DCC79_07675 [bacterium]|nr:MAG: hypothetical protein DCC79_07675 [bacterium]